MLRRFRRESLFYGAVVLLLALGIGSNMLVFSLVNELLLKPLPVRNPDNLYLLEVNRRVQIRPDTMFYYAGLTEAVQKSPLVAAAVAEQFNSYSPTMVPLHQGDTTRLVSVQMISPNYFGELGIRAYAGRVLDDADATTSGTLAAVLSYQFWQSQFGSDRGVIGRTIRLKDVPFTVAGILPREFHGADIDSAPDVRVPISAEVPLFGPHTWPMFEILVRLRPGVSPERAVASFTSGLLSTTERIMREVLRRETQLSGADLEKNLRLSFSEEYHHALVPVGRGVSQMRNQFSGALWVLVGGVALLLLAVCANVAGLLLARAGERRKEIGIRLAIGAGRRHIIREMLLESLVLAVAGAALGAAFAWVVIPRLLGLLPPVRGLHQFSSPQILAITPDWRILAFAAAVVAFSVLASALIPAWRASRVNLLSQLKSQQAGERAGLAGIVPLALQVVFCTILLSAAVLAARTFHNLQHVDLGFDRDHVVSFTFDPLDAGYTPARAGTFYRDLRDRVVELPGVRAAAYSQVGVMRGIGIKTTIAPEGVTLPKSTFLNTNAHALTADYFRTMGIPLLAGRSLTRADGRGFGFTVGTASLTPVVVNRAFADFFFPHQNPIGKRLVIGTDGTKPPTHVIVGLVGNAKYRSLRETDPPTFYAPMGDRPAPDRSYLLYVRTYGSPASVTSEVRRAAAALGPGVPLVESFTLEQEVEDSLWQERLVALLAVFFGVTSVLLAAIGLYTALAQSVARRTRELGIRIAIGARIRHILETVGAPLGWAIACGLAAGFGASAMLLRLTRPLLYGVQPVDPLSYAAAAVLVLLCAALGAALPLTHALRIDPAAALRSE